MNWFNKLWSRFKTYSGKFAIFSLLLLIFSVVLRILFTLYTPYIIEKEEVRKCVYNILDFASVASTIFGVISTVLYIIEQKEQKFEIYKAHVEILMNDFSQKYFNVNTYLAGGLENVLAKNFYKELLDEKVFITKDETSFFVLLNEILSNAIKSDENNKIEGIYSIFSISRSWQMQYFQEEIQKKQHKLREINPEIEIKKIYIVFNETEYDQSNFVEDKLPAESLLLLLNQMHYSKLFFNEGLKKEDILVFPKIGDEEKRFPYNVPHKNESEQGFSIFLNECQNKDFILIKMTNSSLMIKINRVYPFKFNEAEFIFLEKVEEILKNFESLRTRYVHRAQWEPTDREYALISADKIKNDSVEGGVVYAIDSYKDNTWLDPTEPRWVVWRACKDAIEKLDIDRTGSNQPNNSLKIKRLFIIGDDILADKEKRKNFLLVIAFQYYLDIDVTFVTVEKYKEWAASIDETLIKEIGIDLKNVLPDFSLITDEEQQTISGVNMMDTKNNSHHGRIYEKDENWKKFVDLLFPNSKQKTNALKTEIPTDNKQLILSFKDKFDTAMSAIIENTSLNIKSDDILQKFNEKFKVSYDKIKKAQKEFWDEYWKDNSFVNITSKDVVFDKIDTVFKDQGDYKNNPIKILDVGCGDGRLLKYLHKQQYQIEYYALDQSIQATKNIEGAKAVIINCDLNEIEDSYNNFFDIVIAIDFMNHQFNWEETLEKINRLLKKDGYFIGNALSDKDGSIEYYRRKECSAPETITEYEDSKFLYELDNDRILIMNFSTKENVQGKLQDSGFTNIYIEEYCRVDNAHKHPFIEEKHNHYFYCFTCKNNNS